MFLLATSLGSGGFTTICCTYLICLDVFTDDVDVITGVRLVAALVTTVIGLAT